MQDTLEIAVNENWDKYVGSIWESIFQDLSLDNNGKLVEIAPGKEEKVGYGLASYDFKGRLYLIEPDLVAMNIIYGKYKKLMQETTIIPVPYVLGETLSILPNKVDAIIANHPLDDMIMGKFIGKELPDFFEEKYNTSDCKSRPFWEFIENSPEKLDKVKKEIVSEWTELIKKTNPSTVAISQYKSYFFESHGLLSPDKNALDILNGIRKNFQANVNTEIIESQQEIEEKDRWLVLNF